MPGEMASAAMRWSLQLGPLPTLIALALVAVGVAAGNWQSGRASEKQALRERIETMHREPAVAIGRDTLVPGPLEFRRVSARGRWRSEFGILLDNKIHGRTPGYHVLMPMNIEGTNMHVLVNRGWVAGTGDRSQAPLVTTPDGSLEITGEARTSLGRFLELSPQYTQGKVWQNVTLERFREWSKLELQPIIVFQTSGADDGLIREWERPDFGIDKHRGYAFQWYSLAALTVVFYLIVALRKAPKT